MFVEGFNHPKPAPAEPRRTFGQQLATTATVKRQSSSRPNRLERRRQLALAPRVIRMQVRAAKRAWIPSHPLSDKAMGEDRDAIYGMIKNMLKRIRQGRTR